MTTTSPGVLTPRPAQRVDKPCSVSIRAKVSLVPPNPDHTPPRSFRSPERLWGKFKDHVGERNRSDWLNDFIGWVNNAPRLWHDARTIAGLRNEPLEKVINGALRRYVARHRHLLDDSEDE